MSTSSHPDGLPSVMGGRMYLRFPFLGTNRLVVIVSTDEEQTVGYAEDLSANGIGIVLDRVLDVGAEVILRLWNTDARYGCLRTGEVIHTRLRPEGSYVVGCQFDHLLQGEQLVALTQHEVRRGGRRP